MSDPIHNPAHYTQYPVQPIEISRHLSFLLGNAVKYVLRAPFKGGVEDCNKALKYLSWEGERPSRDITCREHAALFGAVDELRRYLNDYVSFCGMARAQVGFLEALLVYLRGNNGGLFEMYGYVGDLARAIEARDGAGRIHVQPE